MIVLFELWAAWFLSEVSVLKAEGKQISAATEAHLQRAQALIGECKPNEARAELESYLNGSKAKDLPRPVRMTWMQMMLRVELETEAQKSKSVVDRALPELIRTLPELKGLQPAKTQEELPTILEKTGDRVEAFFRDFQNTISTERIEHELLNRNERVSFTQSEKFHYLFMKGPDGSQSAPDINEYRTGGDALVDERHRLPDGMITTSGFASLSMYFLPVYQAECRFVYLGQQRMDNYQTYVVAFAQQPAVAQLLGNFTVIGGASATTLLQGIAWIEAGTHQIICLRTDLLYPVPRIRLSRETTEIHYAEVRFKNASLSLWLPRDVAVTVEWEGKLLRNTHSYSDFMLFNVETKSKVMPESLKEQDSAKTD
ncbi:MAG: hypothetical protein ACYDA9_02790 [Terriglobia bacterium]